MTSQFPKAILFDLDDTILSYAKMAEVVWASVCDRFAPRDKGVDPEDLLNAIREHRDWFWSDPVRHKRGRLNPHVASNEILQKAFDQLGADVPSSLVSEIAETYRVEREEAASPFPGAIDTLVQIRKSGVRLALITNGGSEGQRYKIDRFGIAPLFDYILVEGEFGVGKPDERVYFHALDQLGAKPTEAWMVGDNLEWEIAAPQKLGIRGIWVDWAGNGLPESTTVRPDRIIRAISELL